ncbi:class I SAM-dependent rRNA methyltransferase [Ectothiorhodospiraceae bacterium WFHF3C12]|nr:class I SAM-dependent rRNA methyltransferase [Ectothiorhodospiraceae bacterium WFHF3C12]
MTKTDQLPPLRLKKDEDKRLRRGHLWVFSNEVDTERTPLTGFAPGDAALVEDHRGKAIGCGYVNPHSLICARLVSRDSDHPLNQSLLVHRLKIALALRERRYEAPCYRLVFGEGDGLPGLVVDRFGDVCVVQINTAGMESARDAILGALEKVVRPSHVLWRCDSAMRELEGLDRYVEWAGDAGPETLTVQEAELTFQAPALTGQKTGWYFDHRDNRLRLRPYAKGARVLDLFSYCGAWGVHALAGGAESVVAVDSAREPLESAQDNAKANGFEGRLTALCGDAFEVLESLIADRARFDIVVADPPAFIKRKKDYRAGLGGYRRLNQMAAQLLERDGMLVSASCSAHLAEADLTRTVLAAARHLDRSMQIVEYGQQAADHPIHGAIPESRYLKAIFSRLLPASATP